MLKVRHITTGYGKKQALTDVSFEVAKGKIALLTGGNGSGKSTVLKAIYGLLKPWSINHREHEEHREKLTSASSAPSVVEKGKVLFEGNDITALPVSEMIRRGIVYMPQKKNVFEEFTVEENLQTSAGIYSGQEAKERMKKVFEILPMLETMRKRTPFHLSGGEKQLLAFGNVLVHSPKLILLDEPFAGVDVANSEILRNCIAGLNGKGVTFIIVEHKRQLLDSIVNQVIELELGTLKQNIDYGQNN
ncbi:MAG: ATP-binding cassette domain-containing protein [Dysgonamonadaceae bacterium]|jgi:branched-chain amino acid transport system ATP-binding protein|nr:ATP-binding cassette domain-containing protein [Dysgonamonadaceae bacterium]